MIKMPISGHSYARQTTPVLRLSSRQWGMSMTLSSVVPGVLPMVPEIWQPLTVSSMPPPPTSRDSSGSIGIALADEGKDNVSSPGRRHIISREQLAKMASDLSPTFPSHEETDLDPKTPLLQPPTVVLNASHGSRKSLLASERSMTPGNGPE